MDAKSIEWLIGTAFTAIGVWIAYLQYSRTNVVNSRQAIKIRRYPIPQQRDMSSLCVNDLQAAWKVALSITSSRLANEKMKEIVDACISRGELDFALRVAESISSSRLSNECKEKIVNAHHKKS